MITFTDAEWTIIHDFLSTQLNPISPKISPYNGYDCLRTRIRYGMMDEVDKKKLFEKLGMNDG